MTVRTAAAVATMGGVALTLLLGPANAAKARAVLDGVRAAAERDPLLVVPTAADVDRYRRELAEDGLVFGARVLTFDDLLREGAHRARLEAVVLGELARERVAAAAVRRAGLEVLAASSATPGFARAVGRLFGELESVGAGPGRLAGALRAWAGEDTRRAAYAEELARLYGSYRGTLEARGWLDRELWSRAVLDALREDPGAWGSTPVFFYGFDDLTPLQRDAVETLAERVQAEVWVSLTYEPGRLAFAGRASTVADLLPLAAGRVRELPAVDAYYAQTARAALGGLERGLFEPRGDEPLAPGDAVGLLEAGGERAEAELVAAEVRAGLERGVAPHEIAVVLREPAGAHALEHAFAQAGIPVALRRDVPLGHTALGRALLALLRCASAPERAPASEVVAWLRGPGVVGRPELVDALEAQVRRSGLPSARAALELWANDGRHVPGALERVRVAAERGPAALCEALGDEARSLFDRAASADAGPDAARQEAAAVSAARTALAELHRLAREAPGLVGEPDDLAATLAATPVRLGERPGPGLVTVCDPLALRARRVQVLVLCGLQEGAFPRAPAPDPFFSDDERRELAAHGIRLALREDPDAGAERYLFYAVATRPLQRLVLAFRTAGDDGEPQVPSPFVDDVRALFSGELWERRGRRRLGDAGWDEAQAGAPAPSPAVAARAAAAAREPKRADAGIAPLRSDAVLGALRARPAWSASALEAWASCPVKWFVERYANAKDLEADPEPMVRGGLAHSALEETLRGLLDETGSARLTEERLPEVRERLRGVLERLQPLVPLSPSPERTAAGARRLRADLERYLASAAHDGTRFEPRRFEASFGFDDREEDSLPALELQAPDGPLRLRGRIDRIDVEPGTRRAVVIDYKGRNVAPGEKWLEKRSFQAALYLRAAQELLDLEPAGAFYQPLGAADPRRRGLIADEDDPDLVVVRGDRRPADEVAERLRAVTELALAAAAEARAGALEPRPESCTPRGVCAYPGLCRCEA